jgi:uncharacterized membrane protein
MSTARTIRASEDTAREHWTAVAGRPVVNVGPEERMASKIGGGVLIAAGLLRGGLKGLLLAGLGGALVYRGMTGSCACYRALGISTAHERRGPMASVTSGEGVQIEEAVHIARPPGELYRFWRDYDNLPLFMTNIESVIPTGGNRSRWTARGPLGLRFGWDAEIHNEVPGELIAWRSLDGGDIATAGSVRFSPSMGGRGSEVRVVERFVLPGGAIGESLARFFGQDPASQTRANLRRFKQLMEAVPAPTA